MLPIKMVFDLPVSVNRMYAPNPHGGIRMTYAGKNWKQNAQVMARQQYIYNEPLRGAISVSLKFYGLRLDIDNTLKVTLDSLIGICFEDDKQVMELHCYIMTRKDTKPRMEIEIMEIEK